MTEKKDIRWLVMDVDGTLTDGKIYMGPNGEAMKAFDIKDGYAIHEMLPKMGIEPVIITGRESSIVRHRCDELGIKRLYQGIANKLDLLKRILDQEGLSLANVAYIGDDLNDFECMLAVFSEGGFVACPEDAVDDVAKISNLVCCHAGGFGAVRETIEFISAELSNKWCEA